MKRAGKRKILKIFADDEGETLSERIIDTSAAAYLVFGGVIPVILWWTLLTCG